MRLNGYRKQLQERGVAFDSTLIAKVHSDHIEQMEQAVLKLLRDSRDITALLTISGRGLQFLLRVLNQEQLLIPQDMSVVVFDDDPITQANYPCITVVRQPVVQMGKLGAQYLLDLLRGKRISAPHVILETELVVRDSCRSMSDGDRKGSRIEEEVISLDSYTARG
jgi:LacI family transcriptional regulator